MSKNIHQHQNYEILNKLPTIVPVLQSNKFLLYNNQLNSNSLQKSLFLHTSTATICNNKVISNVQEKDSKTLSDNPALNTLADTTNETKLYFLFYFIIFECIAYFCLILFLYLKYLIKKPLA